MAPNAIPNDWGAGAELCSFNFSFVGVECLIVRRSYDFFQTASLPFISISSAFPSPDRAQAVSQFPIRL